MVFEGALVLEIRAANAIPELPAVLLVGSPIPSHGKGLAALAAHEGLDPMLPLEVRLQRPEVLQRLCTRVLYVVPAPLRTAITRQAQQC